MSNMPEKKIVTVIQARTGSTRLPNKVMLPMLGKPALVCMVERVRAAKLSGTVVVATTIEPEDDIIEAVCENEGFLCFRGHPTDLLDRHFRAGQQFQAEAVVKIPSDVVLIDPKIIDQVLACYLDNPAAYDYVSNLHPETHPDGNDVEVMSMAALEIAWREADRDFEREHTTPFLWENPSRFQLGNVTWETGLNYTMSHRWVLDYQADYELIKTIYERLYPQNSRFGLADILALLEQEPELRAINAKYLGMNWYRHHLDQLKTITPTERHIGQVMTS